MIISRKLHEIIGESKKSLLLLGPRQTGKSTLIKSLSPDLTINLAHEPTFLEFASDPHSLENRMKLAKPKTIFIDEVQRLPSLLNTVQVLIDDAPQAYRFFLTGSSARKLRRGKANLLPGRIHAFELGPLVAAEIGDSFDATKAMSIGTLPGVYLAESAFDQETTLASYAAVYLKEEIQAEALTRDLEGFARFLRATAISAGQFLDVSKLASEAQVKRASAIRFFEILEDTLVATRCEAFAKSARRRLVQHPRYFFFDNGILNGILGNFQVSPDRLGFLFEHLALTQIIHTAKALGINVRISSYRTEHAAEVDLVLEFADGRVVAVECKAGRNVGKSDLRGFASFAAFFGRPFESLVIYTGSAAKMIESTVMMPLGPALQWLFPSRNTNNFFLP